MNEKARAPDALTVDVEEYFHATIFADSIPRKEWDERAGRASSSLARLLERFDAWGVRATFFFLGWYAERNPGAVRDVVTAGHEVAAHGYDHTLLPDLGPRRFREDLRRTKGLLEESGGAAVAGYRAPTFSITDRTLWAIPILAEEGFAYDSSVFPIRHDRYGIPGFPRRPVRLRFEGGSLVEFPLSTWRIGPWNVPVAGGGYLRLLPLPVMVRGLRAVRREGAPAVLYLHPWEIDPGQPRIPLPLLSRIRHYRNLDRAEDRLGRLLRDGSWAPMGEILRELPLDDHPLRVSPALP
ncbi:MAG: XrtA system polysaccharide deacetylase [Candidatus Eisenbacteria bacterium]